jgi:hypothetical protein
VILSAGTAHATLTTPTATTFLGAFHLTRTGFAGDAGATDLACFTVQGGEQAPTVLGAGAVTDPDAACRELAVADGDPALLLVHPAWTTSDLVAPVTVTVSGSWGPADVSWSHTFLNSSQLAKYTGDVFGF